MKVINLCGGYIYYTVLLQLYIEASADWPIDMMLIHPETMSWLEQKLVRQPLPIMKFENADIVRDETVEVGTIIFTTLEGPVAWLIGAAG